MTDNHNVAGSNPAFKKSKLMMWKDISNVNGFQFCVKGELRIVNNYFLESLCINKKLLFRHRSVLKSMRKVKVRN